MKRIKFASAFLLLAAMSCNKADVPKVTEPAPLSMESTMKAVNPVALRTAITSNDLVRVTGELKPLYNKIVAYELSKGNDISGEEINTVITYAFLKMEFEKSQRLNVREESLDCFMTAVGSIIGLAGARSVYNSFMAGAATETIIGFLRVAAGRVATVFTVAWAVYEVADCMGLF